MRERFGDCLFLIGGYLLIWSAQLNKYPDKSAQLRETIQEGWQSRKKRRALQKQREGLR